MGDEFVTRLVDDINASAVIGESRLIVATEVERRAREILAGAEEQFVERLNVESSEP